MEGLPILSLMLAVPLVAAVICLFLSAEARAGWRSPPRWSIYVLGILLWLNFDIGGAQWQFVEAGRGSASSAGRWASTASR